MPLMRVRSSPADASSCPAAVSCRIQSQSRMATPKSARDHESRSRSPPPAAASFQSQRQRRHQRHHRQQVLRFHVQFHNAFRQLPRSHVKRHYSTSRRVCNEAPDYVCYHRRRQQRREGHHYANRTHRRHRGRPKQGAEILYRDPGLRPKARFPHRRQLLADGGLAGKTRWSRDAAGAQ